jgi:transcriptional regulator with XRE-family HTH domain
MNNVGSYIKEKRLSLGWSKRVLAQKAGISHSEVHRIENGERRNPSVPILYSIADALDIPRETILQLAGYELSESSSEYKKVIMTLRTQKQQDTAEKIIACMARNGNLNDDDYDSLLKQVEMFIEYAKRQ